MESLNIKAKVFGNKKKTPKPKSKTNSGERMTKDQLTWAIQKKKECNARALCIVKELIEPLEDKDFFLSKLKDINQCHYQDIVEERAISKICGYPLCNEDLEEMPRQQFHISLTNKKVYDITDRKHFCSNFCYRASLYVKEQLLTSPLWLRGQEVIPEIHLLFRSNANTKTATKDTAGESDDSNSNLTNRMVRLKREFYVPELNIEKSKIDQLLGEVKENKECLDIEHNIINIERLNLEDCDTGSLS